MKLYVDLHKGRVLNTGKLVKKRVMVRGKNGKVFYRMQWVDPKTGEAPHFNHIKVQPQDKKEASKKTYDKSTQKGFIDHHVDKNMTREEKYAHLAKHGIQWKRNDHEAIDHKNAMMALKDHLYKNPHLVGAEHLPKESSGEKDIDFIIDEFTKNYKNHPELLYDMMKHLGVIDKDHVDPRTIPELKSQKEGGNGKGAIMHMRTMMDLKKHLRDNPHLVNEMMAHEKFGSIHGGGSSPKIAEEDTKDKPPQQPVKQTKAQKGNNTISDVLKSMSAEDLYKLMKAHGVAEIDPRLDPSIEEKTRPIHHMRNMMALKRIIEQNPDILNKTPGTDEISDEEKERLKGITGKEKLDKQVSDFLGRASKELKTQWADDYSDHEHMKNRPTSEHENIDHMRKMEALKKILKQDPSILEELQPELEREELLNMKIGNKDMGKFLRQVAGLKGIGDVVAGFERGKQWEFGIDSTAEITEDDEGEPILSVLDTGPDGEDYNEMVFPLKKVKEFLDGIKNGKRIEVKAKEVPLHKKSPVEIWRELNKDFESNYTDDVGRALHMEVSRLWDANRTNNIHDLLKDSPIHIDKGTFLKLLGKYGVKTTSDGRFFEHDDNAWKNVVYGHKIEAVKSKNALQYLEKNPNGSNDTWVLHESARQWDGAQRAEARKEFIKHRISIEGNYPDMEDRETKLISHIHTGLEHVPFDLMTDIMANGGNMFFHKKGYNGEDNHGSFYSAEGAPGGGIWFDHGYADDDSLMDSTHPMHYIPSPRGITDSDGNNAGNMSYHPFSDTIAHEFAHAVDNFLSGGGNGNFLKWDSSKEGKKYAGKHSNVVRDSYTKAVERSNPKHYVGHRKDSAQEYYFHLDQFMSHYEGRIYTPSTLNQDMKANTIRDVSWSNTSIEPVEHWSENVARMANAVHAYKKWKEDTGNTSVGMDSWASMMHRSFMNKGYGDDATVNKTSQDGIKLKSYTRNGSEGRNNNLMEAYGYLYHTMSKRHPELQEGIKQILLRPDFIDDNSTTGVIPRAERGDHIRKSDTLLYLDLEG